MRLTGIGKPSTRLVQIAQGITKIFHVAIGRPAKEVALADHVLDKLHIRRLQTLNCYRKITNGFKVFFKAIESNPSQIPSKDLRFHNIARNQRFRCDPGGVLE